MHKLICKSLVRDTYWHSKTKFKEIATSNEKKLFIRLEKENLLDALFPRNENFALLHCIKTFPFVQLC